MPFVALLASIGRGYMPAFGWAVFTIVLAHRGSHGWGDWFPWSVPALFSGVAGPRAALMGNHSYVIVIVASIIGLTATFYWWRSADQTK
jgi:ABC-2 type transport system permease protein